MKIKSTTNKNTKVYNFYNQLGLELVSDFSDVRAFLNEQWNAFSLPNEQISPVRMDVRLVIRNVASRFKGNKDTKLTLPKVKIYSGSCLELRFNSARNFFKLWPYVEFIVEEALTNLGYKVAHAAVIENKKGCIVISGKFGSGKTLISLALSSKGGTILADDGCFLTNKSFVFPYPRPPNYSSFHRNLCPDWIKTQEINSKRMTKKTDGRKITAYLYTECTQGNDVILYPIDQSYWIELTAETTEEEQKRGAILLENLSESIPSLKTIWKSWISELTKRNSRKETSSNRYSGSMKSYRIGVGDQLTNLNMLNYFLIKSKELDLFP